jgi:hypothetical protein
MVLAVIFAQRWKVIDARAPAGAMSGHVRRYNKFPLRQGLSALARGRFSPWLCAPKVPDLAADQWAEIRDFPAVSRVIRCSKYCPAAWREPGWRAKEGCSIVWVCCWPHAHVGWRSLDEMAEPGYEQSDTSSQPHLNVRVCSICITPGSACTPPNAGTGRRWPA